MRIDCPFPGCDGQVLTKRLEMFGVVMVCDGEFAHSDTVIRNAFVRAHEDLDAIDPDTSDAILARLDPVEFLRDQVLRSLEKREGGTKPPTAAMLIPPPTYPTGLNGVTDGRLLACQGLTIYSGKASSGKTWAALRASLDAAERGWDVIYLACEGVAVVNERVDMILGSKPRPELWGLRVIEPDTRIEQVVEWIASSIRSERTLLVIDSFSTMLDHLEDDADEWGRQRKLERMLFNLRQDTAGCIGLLVISEANAAGETRGRRFDHMADLSVNFEKDADDPEIKSVRVVKSWWTRMGHVGNYAVRPSFGGMVRVAEGDTPNEERRFYVVGGGEEEGF